MSRTLAPLVADSLLNFTSGSVRTNTLRITAETASQPILLLTGSDLESQNEVDLVARYAGATYTLTGQWQHTAYGGDVLNQTDARQVSLICSVRTTRFLHRMANVWGKPRAPDGPGVYTGRPLAVSDFADIFKSRRPRSGATTR